MSGKRYTLTLDKGRMNPMLQEVADAACHKAARRAVDRTRDNIQAAGRVDTGRMMQSTRLRRVSTNLAQVEKYQVYVEAPYARWQEEGHKVAWITPKRAKVLVFRPKGSGSFVFAKKVRGTKGAHFLRDAVRSLRVKDFV